MSEVTAAGSAVLGIKQRYYRADIDGLRALAVVAVILYHLSASIVPGGYVGVDVFFVISGYLITGNIWRGVREGNFSITSFYLKRIRRIAPAVLTMTLVVLLVGCFLMQPADMVGLAGSAFASSLSWANIYFWQFLDTGYFAQASDQVPLLHMWSLGVEEQFYLLWPGFILLVFFWRKRRSDLAIAAVAIGALSFVVAELTNTSAFKFSYYMLPARAGELMMGSVLALWENGVRSKDLGLDSTRVWYQRTSTELAAVAGLGFLAYSLYGLNDASPFPGINALWPCLGATLVIFAGGKNSCCVRWLFTSRWVVHCGLISYSLYLWHWPIFAFTRYFLGDLSLEAGMLGLVATFLISEASFRYVEQPWRHWKSSPRLQVAALFVLPVTVVAVLAAVVFTTGGFRNLLNQNSRYVQAKLEAYSWTAAASSYPFNCQESRFQPDLLRQERCVIGPIYSGVEASSPRVLLWGDSRAAQWVGFLSQIAKAGNFNFRNATHSDCGPVFARGYGSPRDPGCYQFVSAVKSAVASGSFDTIIVSGSWPTYYGKRNFKRDFEYTINYLTTNNMNIVILGSNPGFPRYDRECFVRAARFQGTYCFMRGVERDYGSSSVDKYLKDLAERTAGVYYMSMRDLFCKNTICLAYLNGHPVYYDKSHVSMRGGLALGKRVASSNALSDWLRVLGGQPNE